MYMQIYVNINKATYPYMITCICIYIYIYIHTHMTHISKILYVCVCDIDIVYILFLNIYRYSNVYNNYFGTIFLGNMYIIILNKHIYKQTLYGELI